MFLSFNLQYLSGCLSKILITQIGHKIDFLQILYVNCTLSGYFKNTFRLGSMLSSTVYKGGPLVDKNGHFIGTKMPIFNNFGNSSQDLKFDAGQNSTVV